jgi:hypothetical protein
METKIGFPGTENLDLTPWQLAWVKSPVELRVIDSNNHVTGIVNGNVKQDIPDSVFYKEIESSVIFSDTNINRYELVGTDKGIYSVFIAKFIGSDGNVFTALDIPTSPSEIHQYIFDWDTLSQGKDGVKVRIDSNGDGIFEKIVTADKELTYDEFTLQTATIVDLKPDTLYLNSKEKWVTAYIELPQGYSVNQIDSTSIVVEDTIHTIPKTTTIGDYDSDGVPDLMVKFDCNEIKKFFAGKPVPGNYDIELTGNVGGSEFKGVDKIRVIAPN